MRLWLPFLALALVGCGASAERAPQAAAATSPLPASPLEDLDGHPSSLPEYLHGRPALIAFWATWCDACFEEMPSLNRLQEQARKRDDAVVLGVAIGEDRDKVATFAKARGLTYPLLVDANFALADALGERRVPTTLVVDRDARIVFRGGALDEASLAAFHGVIVRR